MKLQTTPSPVGGAQPTINTQQMIIGLIIWIVLLVGSYILLKKGKMTKKWSIIFLLVAFIVSGVVLGAQPSPLMPIQNIITTAKSPLPASEKMKTLLPMIIILLVLLLTGIFAGRIFCSYACPLGAIQELASKIRYKSKPRKKEKTSVSKNLEKYSSVIRWVFFIVFIAGIAAMGLTFAKWVNPFLGFQAFTGTNFAAFVIPFSILMVIMIASIFSYRPWCRYFCPFGALVSQTSKLGKNKLIRNENCIECGICEKVCPTDESKRGDNKSECYLCIRCIESCPKDAIDFAKTSKN